MKTVPAYRADDGTLETDPKRAKASDIAYAFSRRASNRPGIDVKSKVDWHVALEILENIDLIMPHLQELQNILTPPVQDK